MLPVDCWVYPHIPPKEDLVKRYYAVAVSMLLVVAAQAEGKHIAKAVLQSRSGATVAVASADSNGTVRFTNVPPGEYRLVPEQCGWAVGHSGRPGR